MSQLSGRGRITRFRSHSLEKRDIENRNMPVTVPEFTESLFQSGRSSLGEIGQLFKMLFGYFFSDFLSKTMGGKWCEKPAGSFSCKLVNGLSFSMQTSWSFSKSLNYVSNWGQPLLRMGDISVSLIGLKSIDPFISQEEEILLQLSNANFYRGWLYGNVIAFFLAKVLQNKPKLAALYGEEWNIIGSKLYQLRQHDTEVIFIPLNLDNHWVLLVAYLKEKKFSFFDPQSQDCSSKYQDLIHSYSIALHEVFSFPIEPEIRCPLHACQQDRMSCGVFVCFYVYQIVSGCEIHVNPDVLSFRKQIYNTIVGKCLGNERYTPCSEFDIDQCKICLQKH